MVAGSRTRGKGKNSEMLARRRAALERAAERVAEERRAAAQAEAERLRREAEFDELVVDFELAVEDETSVAAEVEEEVRRVRERGQVRIEAARVAAARVVLAMGEAGETVAGCGRRLGVGVERVKELRRLGRADLVGEGSDTARQGGKSKASALEEAGVVGKATAAGEPGGELRDGVRAAESAGAVSPVAARPASAGAPVAPPPVVFSTGASAGPSGAPGAVGGVRPESSG